MDRSYFSCDMVWRFNGKRLVHQLSPLGGPLLPRNRFGEDRSCNCLYRSVLFSRREEIGVSPVCTILDPTWSVVVKYFHRGDVECVLLVL